MNNFIRTLPSKMIIYVLTCVMMLVAIASVGEFVACYNVGLYECTSEAMINDEVTTTTFNAAQVIIADVIGEQAANGKEIDDCKNNEAYMNVIYDYKNLELCVTDEYGKELRRTDEFDQSKVKYTYFLKANDTEELKWDATKLSSIKDDPNGMYMTVMIYYEGNDGMPNNNIRIKKILYDTMYKNRNVAIPAGIVSAVLSLVFFILMLCVSARRPNSEELYPGYFNKIPYDVMLVVALIVFGIFAAIADSIWADEVQAVVIGTMIIYCVITFNALSMSAAARIKQGTLLTNTLVYKVCRWCFKLVKKIVKKYVFGMIKWFISLATGMFDSIKEIFQKFPLIWKSVAVFCGISFIELVVLGISDGEWDNYLICWCLGHIVLLFVVCRFALGLRGLQAGGRALAAGDFEHIVDTSKLHIDFKEHGENLNRISEGMLVAVEEKMKSERMKTELITNVSHDIKTPLTSIINYADLIGKEDTDNEKIKEYTEVLLRQSERLKRLIEDLVEASKASTGNLEVELAPCEASMFITQIAGEYEEKLNKAGLTLITKGLDNSAYIMADGRRMLRVFDNLMNNICKYALENSRVNLSLEVNDGLIGVGSSVLSNNNTVQGENDIANNSRQVLITFKNTSRTELDMSPEELMERFVRGDQSRNTEGNGLGLSIARSLTELQNGTFDIFIDGDLFKVVLAFPVKE